MLARLAALVLVGGMALSAAVFVVAGNNWITTHAPWAYVVAAALLMGLLVLGALNTRNARHGRTWREAKGDVQELWRALGSWGWRGFANLTGLVLAFTLLGWLYVWLLSTEAARGYVAVGLAIATLWVIHRIANPPAP